MTNGVTGEVVTWHGVTGSDIAGECITCAERVGETNECPEPTRPCGHHCNHVWTHDRCCRCGQDFGEEA